MARPSYWQRGGAGLKWQAFWAGGADGGAAIEACSTAIAFTAIQVQQTTS
jgi:hypothetical protein